MMKTIQQSPITITLPVPTYRQVIRAFIAGLILGFGIWKFFISEPTGQATPGIANYTEQQQVNSPADVEVPEGLQGNVNDYIVVLVPASVILTAKQTPARKTNSRVVVKKVNPVKARVTLIIHQLETIMNSGPASWMESPNLLQRATRKKARGIISKYSSAPGSPRADEAPGAPQSCKTAIVINVYQQTNNYLQNEPIAGNINY